VLLGAAGQPPHLFAQALVGSPVIEIMPLEQTARRYQHVDLTPFHAGDAKHLGDRLFGKSAGTFDAVQPLLGDRRQQPVVVEQRGRRIVRAAVQTEDQHRAVLACSRVLSRPVRR